MRSCTYLFQPLRLVQHSLHPAASVRLLENVWSRMTAEKTLLSIFFQQSDYNDVFDNGFFTSIRENESS